MSLSANQRGDDPEPAPRGAASPRRARTRFRRACLLMSALVTAGLFTAACGGSFLSVRNAAPASGASSTVSSLDQAGYRNVGIGLDSGSGLSPDGQVNVSYSAGPAGTAETDVRGAERIAWSSLGYRFGVMTISQTSGGCALGVFCSSSSTEIASETYAQLRAEFGPRPAGLDRASVSQTDPMPAWFPGALSACLTIVLAGVAAVIWARRRRPRSSPGSSSAWW